MAFADPHVDFDGDGKSDVLVFRSSDGPVAQWLSNGAGGWNYQSTVYIGGGGFSGAQLIPGDFMATARQTCWFSVLAMVTLRNG
jgi:hypothetical protein